MFKCQNNVSNCAGGTNLESGITIGGRSEDGTGIADVTIFGDVQEKCGQTLFREGWLKVEGRVQRRGPKVLSIIADNLSPEVCIGVSILL